MAIFEEGIHNIGTHFYVTQHKYINFRSPKNFFEISFTSVMALHKIYEIFSQNCYVFINIPLLNVKRKGKKYVCAQ